MTVPKIKITTITEDRVLRLMWHRPRQVPRARTSNEICLAFGVDHLGLRGLMRGMIERGLVVSSVPTTRADNISTIYDLTPLGIARARDLFGGGK